MNTFVGDYQTLTGNYSWNKLTSAVTDPIVPAFNTPEHKFNLGWNIRNYPWKNDDSKLIGAGVNYKWVQGFVFEDRRNSPDLYRLMAFVMPRFR